MHYFEKSKNFCLLVRVLYSLKFLFSTQFSYFMTFCVLLFCYNVIASHSTTSNETIKIGLLASFIFTFSIITFHTSLFLHQIFDEHISLNVNNINKYRRRKHKHEKKTSTLNNKTLER